MVISPGDVCWASLDDPFGPGAGFLPSTSGERAGGQLQCQPDPDRGRVPLASNQRLGAAPGNVTLPAATTGLPKDSVANVSQMVAIDRELLTERVGHLTDVDLCRIMVGIDLLGRD